MSKKNKKKEFHNPFKGRSAEEQLALKKMGIDVTNYRMPAMPRPTLFDDKTKFKRSRDKQKTLREIRDY